MSLKRTNETRYSSFDLFSQQNCQLGQIIILRSYKWENICKAKFLLASSNYVKQSLILKSFTMICNSICL